MEKLIKSEQELTSTAMLEGAEVPDGPHQELVASREQRTVAYTSHFAITGIDTSVFPAQISFYQKLKIVWRDPAFVNEDADVGEWDPVDPALHPQMFWPIVVWNQVDVTSRDEFRVCFPKHGFIHYTIEIKAEAAWICDLHRFPFDRMLFTNEVWVTFPKNRNNEPVDWFGDVLWRPMGHMDSNDKCTDMATASAVLKESQNVVVLSDEWDPSGEGEFEIGQISCWGTKGNSFEFTTRVKLNRNATFYGWNVAFILALITALSGLSFIVPATDTADRLSVSLTLMLTAVSFKIAAADYLPKVAYLTRMDMFVMSMLVLLSLVCFFNGLSGMFESEEFVEVLDSGCLIALSVSWCILTLSATIMMSTDCSREPWDEIKDGHPFRAQLKSM